MRLSKLQVMKSRNRSKFGVKPEEFVVEKSLWLDALHLNWLGVIGGSPLHGH